MMQNKTSNEKPKNKGDSNMRGLQYTRVSSQIQKIPSRQMHDCPKNTSNASSTKNKHLSLDHTELQSNTQQVIIPQQNNSPIGGKSKRERQTENNNAMKIRVASTLKQSRYQAHRTQTDRIKVTDFGAQRMQQLGRSWTLKMIKMWTCEMKRREIDQSDLFSFLWIDVLSALITMMDSSQTEGSATKSTESLTSSQQQDSKQAAVYTLKNYKRTAKQTKETSHNTAHHQANSRPYENSFSISLRRKPWQLSTNSAKAEATTIRGHRASSETHLSMRAAKIAFR